MTTASPIGRRTTEPGRIAATALPVLALFLGACASAISVTTDPKGATAMIDAKPVGTTPTEVPLAGSKPVTVDLRLEGYFPETFVYTPDANRTPIFAHLEPMTQTKHYDITTTPAGATVTLDNASLGTTPLSNVEVVFTRESKNSPWRTKRLVVARTNYQTETLTLGSQDAAIAPIELGLLKEDRVYAISATNTDGSVLNADVSLNGTVVGKTPYQLPITFQRADKSAAWPRFNVTAEIAAKYKVATQALEFASRTTTVPFKLEPITEIPTTRIFPSVVMSPTGAELRSITSTVTAILSTRETGEVVTELKAVTPFTRKDLPDAAATRVESINSFCLTPDGQNVIFGRTERDEQGSLFSNLFIKRADDAAGGVSQLTTGSRYWDAFPYIANDGSNFLVFTSNRGDRNKPDIARVTLVENRLSGGISRLTNDNRFNYAPTYGDGNRQLFYLSTEPNFPRAEPQISSIRLDGSLPTQMSITALELNNTFADKVIFVKNDTDTKTKQIFSITADGKLETALLTQEDFRKSNCFNPAVSPDGNRLLFVSDHGADEFGRKNNDIYLINANGTGLQRLTQNGSDDIMPAWSPSEEGVVFFLSNRGGAYNVWRMKLLSGAK